jgi:hypothetical protein
VNSIIKDECIKCSLKSAVGPKRWKMPDSQNHPHLGHRIRWIEIDTTIVHWNRLPTQVALSCPIAKPSTSRSVNSNSKDQCSKCSLKSAISPNAWSFSIVKTSPFGSANTISQDRCRKYSLKLAASPKCWKWPKVKPLTIGSANTISQDGCSKC